MITISPFAALRPEVTHAKEVASRPYDVMSTEEARIETQGNSKSFLHILQPHGSKNCLPMGLASGEWF